MELSTLWFILVTVLFIGFFLLEGFDYGVGILMPFLSREDGGRRQIINAIGPVWDGNEVWMITAGGALFATFPQVYATLFSGFYLALILMLVALILRGVGFEFRGQRKGSNWRRMWDWAIFTGSLLPALLWGVTVANLMRGFAIQQDMNYYGGLLPLLNPFALLGGFVFVSLFCMHGANYLARKLEGNLAAKASRWAFTAWASATLLTVVFLAWTFLKTDILTKAGINGFFPALAAALVLLIAGWLIRSQRTGWAFIAGSLVILLATVMVFAGLYPRILISSLDPAWSLTVSNTASSPYTLRVISIVAAIFLPIVIAYQVWSYWIFRKRVSDDPGKLTY